MVCRHWDECKGIRNTIAVHALNSVQRCVPLLSYRVMFCSVPYTSEKLVQAMCHVIEIKLKIFYVQQKNMN